MLSTGAQHLWSVIYDHPVTRPIWAFIERLSVSPLQFSIKEFDGAASNDRLFEELKNQCASKPVLDFGMTCRNHATNLTVIMLATVAGMAVVNSLYCFGAFLNLGGHFLRMVAKVASFVISFNIFHL